MKIIRKIFAYFLVTSPLLILVFIGYLRFGFVGILLSLSAALTVAAYAWGINEVTK